MAKKKTSEKISASEVTNEFLNGLTVENVATEIKKINLGRHGRPYLEKKMIDLGIANEIIEAFKATKGTYIAPSRRKGNLTAKITPLEKLINAMKIYCGDDANDEEFKVLTEKLKKILETVIDRKAEKEKEKEKEEKYAKAAKIIGVSIEEFKAKYKD